MEEHHPYFAPSSMARAWLCPGSVGLLKALRAAGVLLEWETAAARSGTRDHAYLDPASDLEELEPDARRRVERAREYVLGIVRSMAGEDATAESGGRSLYDDSEKTFLAIEYERVLRYEVPVKEVDPDLEPHVRRDFKGRYAEFTFGRADVVIYVRRGDERRAAVLDLKFGRGELKRLSASIQGSCYARMAMDRFEPQGVSTVDFRVFHVETGEEIGFTFDSREELDKRLLAIPRRVTREPKRFRVTREGCEFCPAAPWCESFAAEVESVRQESEPLLEVAKRNGAAGAVSDPKKLMRALDMAAPVANWAERLRKIAQEILKAGGRIADETGEWLIEELPGDRLVVDPIDMAGVVADVLSREEYRSLLRLPIGALETKYGEKLYAFRGGKGATIDCDCGADPACPRCKGKGSYRNSKKAATERFRELTGELVERGAPKLRLRRKAVTG